MTWLKGKFLANNLLLNTVSEAAGQQVVAMHDEKLRHFTAEDAEDPKVGRWTVQFRLKRQFNAITSVSSLKRTSLGGCFSGHTRRKITSADCLSQVITN
jgi:hypothetical protein